MRNKPQFGPSALAFAVLAMTTLGSEARAQTLPATNTVGALNDPQSFCVVQKSGSLKINIGDAEALVARCGVYTVPLGRAETFKAFSNQSANAVLVDLRNPQSRRLILISRQGDGQPLTEDVSGQISMSAGKGPLSPIAELDIDLDSFASDGTIGVNVPASKGEAIRAGRIDLKHQVEALRTAGFKFSKTK